MDDEYVLLTGYAPNLGKSWLLFDTTMTGIEPVR